MLIAGGLVVWPLLFTKAVSDPGATLGALFFLGLIVETFLLRSKLRAAAAMEIYGGIFLDRTGAANTPGPLVLAIVVVHGAVTIAGAVLALSAIGENWASPSLSVIAVLTIVVCRAIYIGFIVAAPGEGPGSGPTGAMLLEFGGALYVVVFVAIVWSALFTNPNDWPIKTEGRPEIVDALILCGPAVLLVLFLRAPILLIERRSAKSMRARLARWALMLLAGAAAISPVALLVI